MKTLTFLTLLLITSSSVVGKTMTSNQTGFVGQDVLLSCNCSNEPNDLSWQKGMTIVNVHLEDKSLIDVSYKDRTQIFLNNEKTNCSLLIRNISKKDEGLYTCHALTSVHEGGRKFWSRKSSDVFLTVDEKTPETDGQTGEESVTAVSVSVPILVVALILAVSLLLTFMIRRRHRTNTDTDIPAEEPMLENV
ncbi:uncharacterized protein [Garra rufa]|uniref:uncharacterized protein n=1 Tax=Garra rufa TaxID=137080 RepID=UPI003CCED8B2